VQRAHRRHQSHDAVARRVEIADRGRDDHGCVTATSAS
jgi:hypothetical protein